MSWRFSFFYIYKMLDRKYYIEVGDQKFISLNSDGFAFITLCGAAVVFDWANSSCSSVSSLIWATDVDDVAGVASRWMPSRLDRNQPRPPFSVVDAVDGFTGAIVNVPVKYGFGLRRNVFGDPSGDAGNDFEPRRPIRRDGGARSSSKWFFIGKCGLANDGSSEACSAFTSSASLLNLRRQNRHTQYNQFYYFCGFFGERYDDSFEMGKAK